MLSTLMVSFLLTSSFTEIAQSSTFYTYENSPCKKTQYYVGYHGDYPPVQAYRTWTITEEGHVDFGEREVISGPVYIVFVEHAFWTRVSWGRSGNLHGVLVKTLGEGEEKDTNYRDFGECNILENLGLPCPSDECCEL